MDGHLPSSSFLAALLVLGVLECGSILVRKLTVARAGVRASRRLHARALRAVLAAPCAWFDDNPSGQIQARLVKDVAAVDSALPEVLPGLVLQFMNVVGVTIIIAANAPLALVVLGLGIVPYCVSMRRWVRSAWLSLERMAAASRTPVLAHMLESLSGVSVINAYVCVGGGRWVGCRWAAADSRVADGSADVACPAMTVPWCTCAAATATCLASTLGAANCWTHIPEFCSPTGPSISCCSTDLRIAAAWRSSRRRLRPLPRRLTARCLPPW